MRKLIVFLFFIYSFVNAGPVTPIYPKNLNIDEHQSISLSLRSNDGESIALINEYFQNNNKRTDLATVQPTSNTISFIKFKGDSYSILTNPDLNEVVCSQVGEIDNYLFVNHLKKAWKKHLSGEMIFVGKQLVDNVECNVWRFTDNSFHYEIYTTISNNLNDSTVLKKLVLSKGNNPDIIYDKFSINFDKTIDDNKFEVPNNIKCE